MTDLPPSPPPPPHPEDQTPRRHNRQNREKNTVATPPLLKDVREDAPVAPGEDENGVQEQKKHDDSPRRRLSLLSSSSSSSCSSASGAAAAAEEEESVPRSDFRRNLRRRLHVGRKPGGGVLKQKLQQLRKARQGSSRLRLPSDAEADAIASPPADIRPPSLRRTITPGGTVTLAVKSIRDTLAAATRGDHLRRLSYKRFIQSGLVWERLEDTGSLSPVAKQKSRAVTIREEPERIEEETVEGRDIVFRKDLNKENGEEEEKVEEALEQHDALENEVWSPLRDERKEPESMTQFPTEVASVLTTEKETSRTALAPVKEVETSVEHDAAMFKPSPTKEMSSSLSYQKGKKDTVPSSFSDDELDEDEAYLLGVHLDVEGVEDDEVDEDDKLLWEEIRKQLLNEDRTSDLSANIRRIHELLQDYSALYPTTSSRRYGIKKTKITGDEESSGFAKSNDFEYDALLEQYPVQVRLQNVTYQIQQSKSASRNRIPTVYNTSIAYPILKVFKRYRKEGLNAAWQQLWEKPDYETVDILRDVDLVLQPGRSYLVLGPPGSGKTTLLKAIAGRLRSDVRQKWTSSGDETSAPPSLRRRPSNASIVGSMAGSIINYQPCEVPDKPCTILQGRIQYNGRAIPEGGKEFFIENAMVYIDQLDQHAPRLTVDETFEFAFQCKTGGEMFRDKIAINDAMKEAMEKAKTNRLRVNVVLQALGLTHVRDTFVGDQSVRGISGGQRRRVTVGEMLMDTTPVLCGDEISTGLDAASTYDMVETLLYVGRLANMTRVLSLLQPSPETVSLFDEVILLAEGRILYAGPMEDVEGYFADLGYRSPEFMDVADFLQQVSTEDGAQLYHPPDEIRAVRPNAPTIEELADIFYNSHYGQSIRHDLHEPHWLVWREDDEGSVHGSRISGITKLETVTKKYANKFLKSTWLVTERFLTLWTRDLRVIMAAAVKNILMGVSVGGVFSGIEDEISIAGALFQSGLFIMLGAIQASSSMVTDRLIFYKHADANFYSAWPFVIGRTLSNFPQTIADVVLFGTILYYMVGLAGREDFGNFLTFLCILILFSLVMQQQLAVFAAVASSSGLQVYSSILLLFLILFGGFIVSPEAIPHCWSWVYWWNPFAWAYRAIIINEFRSARWENPDASLERVGYRREQGQEWVGFAFIYMGLYFVLCCVLTALGLTYIRNATSGRPGSKLSKTTGSEENSQPRINIAFTPVDLTFQDICYDVSASKGKGTLRLLNNVNGIFRRGRMCALMGSSGAGKSTLMDVIAGRKTSGKICGEIRLNGFLKDQKSFRRASGYVEQFDVQSPELTVRETVLFSARLRIDRDLVESEDNIREFVDVVLKDAELDDLADALVGDDEGSGLSFEQKKRLSIAVELAASPSIIFLDEPTSGLDARSAMLVVRTLRKIADAGRTICATIHQPSSSVFDMFDDLLLLKKGGEVVYHGPTGVQSLEVVNYFESLGAPRIELGENPANWMLRVMSNDSVGDLAHHFRLSSLFREIKEQLESIAKSEPSPSQKIQYKSEFATSKRYRQSLVTQRLQTIYWRSPAYNLSRLMVSGTVAFILGSIFLWARFDDEFSEADMRARLSVIFLSFIITGMLAIFGSIPVMTKLRDMFYRHRISGMYGSSSIGIALGSAEKTFIMLSTLIFSIVFLSSAQMMNDGVRFFRGVVAFWGFFTFNFAIYSYFGQAFVCLVKPTATALILSSVFIGLNNFFSGLIVRPQFMVGTFFALPYYISPGHYVYEGLVTSLYTDDTRDVYADAGSAFWQYLVDIGVCSDDVSAVCVGSVEEYVTVFFGDKFSIDNSPRNAIILGFVLILTRGLTYLALKYIRFSD